MCFGVKILNFVFFGFKKSGISAFLVSAENGAGVDKITNITYVRTIGSKVVTSEWRPEEKIARIANAVQCHS